MATSNSDSMSTSSSDSDSIPVIIPPRKRVRRRYSKKGSSSSSDKPEVLPGSRLGLDRRDDERVISALALKSDSSSASADFVQVVHPSGSDLTAFKTPVGSAGRGVKRLEVSRLFSFLRDGHSGLEGEDDYASSSASDGSDNEEQLHRIPNEEATMAGEHTSDASLRRDGAVRNVYGSRNDLDSHLTSMNRVLRRAGRKGFSDKQEPIRSFLMLWGILHLVGSKRWKGKDYDDMVGVMSLAVANSSFLKDNAWRGSVFHHDRIGVDCASYRLKIGPFIAPSRRSIERFLPSLLDSVTMSLTYYVVPINTTKTGGAKVVKEAKKAREALKSKIELGISEDANNPPVPEGGDAGEAAADSCEEGNDIAGSGEFSSGISRGVTLAREATSTAASAHSPHDQRNGSVPSRSEMRNGMPVDTTVQEDHLSSREGGRSCPIEMRDGASGGVVAVASLEGLIRFDMLTPGIFRSIMKEADNEVTDPFSIYKIPAVAARHLQYNFTKRLDALLPVEANWGVVSQVSGNFDEEEAVIEGRIKRTSVSVDDRVCVITENSFDRSEGLSFKECTELSRFGAGSEYSPSSAGNPFVFNADAARERSDSTTFEGRVVAVWMVSGSESWHEVNGICKDILQCEAIDERILDGDNVEVHKRILHRDYRSVSSRCTRDEILLMALLSYASYGRKGDGVNRNGAIPSGRKSSMTPSLPWSPLKAGDTVSLIRHGRVCPVTCVCWESGHDITGDAVYAVVVNRFWIDPSVASTFIYVVENTGAAIDAIRTAVDSGSGEYKNENCPYGSSVDDTVCRSKVLRSSTAGREPRGGSTQFMRRTCKVIAIKEGKAVCGKDECNDRHGYLEEHIREVCKTPIRTIGFLGKTWGGLRYVMYRIVLYWDGFTQDVTRGSSVEGVYTQLLNLSPEERRSAAAIRVLCIGPPGCDVNDIIGIVLGDVIRLMVSGIRCWTADGEEIIVFPDLVIGLADTPALTQVLDTRGHTSRTPCTVCRYEIPSEAGKGLRKGGRKGAAAKARVSHRYASLAAHSGLQSARRTADNHQAIRDACPPDNDLLAIGMQVVKNHGKGAPSRRGNDDGDVDEENADDAQGEARDDMDSGMERLPFHLFRSQYEDARDSDKLPRNSEGVSLYPGTFCPYTALLPGVEHLLVGLFKGAMKYVLRLMTSQDRADVNTYLISYMQACGLPVQSQFVNLDSTIGLNTMSMSQSYAVSLFAERSMLSVFNNPNREANVGAIGRQKDLAIPEAIILVKLISEIIALAWVKESRTWDKYGSTYVPLMQGKISEYVSAVARVCEAGPSRSSSHLSMVPDDDSEAAGSVRVGRGGGKRKETAVGKAREEHTFCPSALARLTTDTPNVHKLREVGVSILGNVGHLAKIAELAFEVRHGPVKSSISKNASNDSQIAAMSSAAFSDWSGRIAMTYEGALGDDAGCLLAMVRFLFGEDEYLFCVKNGLSSDMRLKVRNVIGPDDFNPAFLKEHGVKLVGGTRRDAVFGGVVEVWAAEIKHSLLLRYSTRNRLKVHALVAMEAERLREETIKHFDDPDGGHGTDVSKGLFWVGSLRRQLLTSLPPTKRTPSRGGLDRFMRTVVVGSVVRVTEKCLRRLSGTWKIPSVEMRPESSTCLPSFGKDYTFWCVIGLFQIGPSVVPYEALEGTTTEGGQICRALRDDSFGMVLAPCEYSDGYGVRPTLGTIDYTRSMQVSSDALNCVPDSEGMIPGAIVTNADANDDSVMPVAVLRQCEEVSDGGACVVAREDPSDGTSSRVVRHAPNCGVLEGGKFLIRDCFSGFPPRSA